MRIKYEDLKEHEITAIKNAQVNTNEGRFLTFKIITPEAEVQKLRLFGEQLAAQGQYVCIIDRKLYITCYTCNRIIFNMPELKSIKELGDGPLDYKDHQGCASPNIESFQFNPTTTIPNATTAAGRKQSFLLEHLKEYAEIFYPEANITKTMVRVIYNPYITAIECLGCNFLCPVQHLESTPEFQKEEALSIKKTHNTLPVRGGVRSAGEIQSYHCCYKDYGDEVLTYSNPKPALPANVENIVSVTRNKKFYIPTVNPPQSSTRIQDVPPIEQKHKQPSSGGSNYYQGWLKHTQETECARVESSKGGATGGKEPTPYRHTEGSEGGATGGKEPPTPGASFFLEHSPQGFSTKDRSTTDLKRENQQLKDSLMCEICLDQENVSNLLLLPCKHTCCTECFPSYNKHECPFCRTKIESTQKFKRQ